MHVLPRRTGCDEAAFASPHDVLFDDLDRRRARRDSGWHHCATYVARLLRTTTLHLGNGCAGNVSPLAPGASTGCLHRCGDHVIYGCCGMACRVRISQGCHRHDAQFLWDATGQGNATADDGISSPHAHPWRDFAWGPVHVVANQS